MKEKYNVFGMASAIYAVFITFCLYHNDRGVTFPFFVAGTLCYFFYTMRKLEVSCKKDDWFYVVSILLLGTSVFLTMDSKIIVITKLGIFLLFMGFLLHHFYDDSKWTFTKYLISILESVVYTFGALFMPVTDLLSYLDNSKKAVYDEAGNELPRKESKLKYVLLGLLIAVPMLVVVLVSLSNADMVFRLYLEDFLMLIQIENIVGIAVMTTAGYFFSYAIIRSLLKKEIAEDCPDNRTKEPVLAITFTSVITVVYLLFCGIQVMYLFTGNMSLPAGYTYAEYARQGFYELLFVCIMNVTILLICVGFFKESNVLKVILSVITFCTYIMIASSAYRMYLYVSVYHFTFLRLMVFFFLSMLCVMMLGIFIAIYRNDFPLFKYSMVVITCFTIVLAYAHPDYFIAKYNVDHMNIASMKELSANEDYLYSDEYYTNYGDVSYLTNLSYDAAPVLLENEVFHVLYGISSGNMEEYYSDLVVHMQEPVSLRTINISDYFTREAFRNLIIRVPVGPSYENNSSSYFN